MAEKKVTKKTTKPKLPSEVFAVDFNEVPCSSSLNKLHVK